MGIGLTAWPCSADLFCPPDSAPFIHVRPTLFMTRAPARTHFHRSRLLRTLVDLTDFEPSIAPPLAETLGQWIRVTDAIALTGVYGAARQAAPTQDAAGQATSAGAALEHEFNRTRSALEHAIDGIDTPSHGRTRLVRPTLQAGLSVEQASDYAPFRRYHHALQRHQEQAVHTLRATLRDTAAQVSPALKQLAALDATFEHILSEREATLLGTIPSLLEKRFHRLRRGHQQTMLEQQRNDLPEHWIKPGGWLARFSQEMTQVLLAELDFRLQPSEGLLEAIAHAQTHGRALKPTKTHQSTREKLP